MTLAGSRKFLFTAIIVIVFAGVMELVAWGLLSTPWLAASEGHSPARYPRPALRSEDEPAGPARLPRVPGTARIVCMGDSVTFGFRMTPGESYPDQLQRRLDREGVPAEVINCGVVGHSLVTGIQKYFDTVQHLDPDVVIASYGINDHFYNPEPDARAIKIPSMPSRTLQNLLGHSRSYRLMKQILRRPVTGEMRTVRVSKTEFESYLEFFIHQLKKNDTDLLLMNQLSANYDLDLIRYGDIMKDVGARRNIDVIDLYKEFPSLIGQTVSFSADEQNLIHWDQIRDVKPLEITNELLKPFFIDGYHYNSRGYEIVARIVARRLLSRLTAHESD